MFFFLYRSTRSCEIIFSEANAKQRREDCPDGVTFVSREPCENMLEGEGGQYMLQKGLPTLSIRAMVPGCLASFNGVIKNVNRQHSAKDRKEFVKFVIMDGKGFGCDTIVWPDALHVC